MNGEMNGVVEEPSEMPVAGPDSALNTETATSEDCNDDLNNCKNSVSEAKHIGNDVNMEISDMLSTINDTIDETDDSERNEDALIKDVPPKKVEKEFVENKKLDNYCCSGEDSESWLLGKHYIKADDEALKRDAPPDAIQDPTLHCEKIKNSDLQCDTIQNSDLQCDTIQDPDMQCDMTQEPDLQCNTIQEPDMQCDTTQDPELQCNTIQESDMQCDTTQEPDLQCDTIQEPGLQCDTIQDPELQCETIQEPNLQCDTIQDLDLQCDTGMPETSETAESDSIHSVEDSSDESELSACPQAEDTVSINSDSGADGGDDTSQESQTKLKSNELVIVEKEKRPNNQNGDTCKSPSPEVQEIKPDKQIKPVKVPENKVPLRRSSRAIKRKRYDGAMNGDDDSDIEEPSESYRRRSRPIVINDTKALVEMAARQIKTNQGSLQKKEPTIVIIDTNSGASGKTATLQHQYNKSSAASSSSTMSAQNLYQSIVARGTTVTPVPTKANASTQSSLPQPPILPSLTDDMFVVEAPSFIVPYVYEKPSIKPFREFVDVLGNELSEQKAKEEKAEQEKKEQEKKEKIEKGEQEDNLEDKSEKESENDKDTESIETEQSEKAKDTTGTEENETDEEKKKNKSAKRERQKRQKDDDDMSWDGESSSDSEDEVGSDEDDKTVVIKDKIDTVTDLKTVTDLTIEKVVTGKSDNYFDGSLGKFFMNIGLNLVQEFVQNDLLKQQKRKLYKEKKTGQNTKPTEMSIVSLKKNLEFSKNNNAPYSFPMNKCEQCSFKSESALVLSHHMETPHMKNNLYKCNYCTFEIRSPHDILFHMEAEHNIRGRLERAPSYHQCPNCFFEDNGKGKLVRHQIACAKKFKPEVNQSPPVDWESPAKIPKQMSRSRNHMMSPYQSSFQRAAVGNSMVRASIGSIVQGAMGYRPRCRTPMVMPSRLPTVHGTPLMRGAVMIRHSSPSPNNYTIGNNGKNIPVPKTMHQPSISITALPRQSKPPAPVHVHNATRNSCVICEICDGYIKNLEQLRNHMQWIHKVKIHPKMIYNRPPLNCQKCQFRFFTDQGLERHLLGSHGLVTSSMQEAANKGKDAGRCPVCGRIYQWKLLSHVARDHSLTLKPAHLSYKCTVCTATFDMYKEFESHVYSAHSVVAKRAIDKSKPPATTATSTKQGDACLKPLKINDEITIIPQPAKHATATVTSNSDANEK